MKNLKPIDLSHNNFVILNLKAFDFANTAKQKSRLTTIGLFLIGLKRLFFLTNDYYNK